MGQSHGGSSCWELGNTQSSNFSFPCEYVRNDNSMTAERRSEGGSPGLPTGTLTMTNAISDTQEMPEFEDDDELRKKSTMALQPLIEDPMETEKTPSIGAKGESERLQELPKPRHSTSSQGRSGKPLIDDMGRRPSVASGKPFPKRPMFCTLSKATWDKAEELFKKMDQNETNAVTREEAMAFFKGGFQKVSVEAMFSEIDTDMSGAITADEFMDFWKQVRHAGYSDADIIQEMDELLVGGTWVDWLDDRRPETEKVGRKGSVSGVKTVVYPHRPWLCRLSQSTWNKIEELFKKMDANSGELIITREKADAFFHGTRFANVSINAMFNEVDVHHHGNITPKSWLAFWYQVRSSGYSNSNIAEEITGMLEGGAWVDWKDGRTT